MILKALLLGASRHVDVARGVHGDADRTIKDIRPGVAGRIDDLGDDEPGARTADPRAETTKMAASDERTKRLAFGSRPNTASPCSDMSTCVGRLGRFPRRPVHNGPSVSKLLRPPSYRKNMNSGDLGPTDSSNKGHLTRECRVTTEGRGRTVDEWKLRVAGLDNHWLDGLVGSGVAASIQGVELPEMKTYKPERPASHLRGQATPKRGGRGRWRSLGATAWGRY